MSLFDTLEYFERYSGIFLAVAAELLWDWYSRSPASSVNFPWKFRNVSVIYFNNARIYSCFVNNTTDFSEFTKLSVIPESAKVPWIRNNSVIVRKPGKVP